LRSYGVNLELDNFFLVNKIIYIIIIFYSTWWRWFSLRSD